MPNVHLNFFCLIFRWDEKLDIKIWFYCFQFPRVQILLFVGWNSIRVKKSFVHSLLLYCWRVGKWRRHDTAATNFRQRKCLSQSTGTLLHVVKIPLLNFKDLLQKDCGRVVPPADRSLPRCTPAYKSKFLFVFVCFVSLVFFWSRELNFHQKNAKTQMKRNKTKLTRERGVNNRRWTKKNKTRLWCVCFVLAERRKNSNRFCVWADCRENV